jgi:large subunit ribosomal protein L18
LAGRTLASATTVGKKDLPANLTARAEFVGAEIAKSAKRAKVKKVVFDRGQRLYHGRIKALAGAARDNGLEF